MKLKTYINFITAALILPAAVGCSDFLTENLKSELAPDNTYTSSLGFEVGSTGLYSIARSEYNTWGEEGAYIHNGACPYEALQIATDIVFQSGAKDGSLTPFATLTMTSSTQFVETYWKWAYNLIGSANELLVYSEKNDNWDYDTDKALYQAEARFFRAYAYRTLVYLYGDVPWVETIQIPFVLNFTRDSKEEVIEHMIEDLEFAAENLPTDPDAVKEGKLTCWAAYHLLSEIYNLQGEYELAADAALEVIDSGYYSLVTSRFGANKSSAGDAFSDMFIENNQNRSSGNTESIWVMQFEYNTTGGGTNSDDWTRRAWLCQYHSISGFVLADTLGGRGLAQIAPMKWWIGTENTNATESTFTTRNGIYDDGDMRNSKYSVKRAWYYNDETSSSYGSRCNITDNTWSTGTLFPALTKFFYGVSSNLALTGSYKDRMKFRLAETYLNLAEAYIGMGDTENAADAINKVRRRAGAPDVTASEVDIDYLLDERIRELVGEESRRFTLCRTGKYVERVQKYNEDLASTVQEYHALWPIPQTILDSNTEADFPNNPGY